MLEASRVCPPGVEEGAQSDSASEAGGATGSRQGRRQVRAELRTPARGANGAADASEGDPERRAVGGGDAGGGAERELEMCRAGAGNVRRLQLLH